MNIHKAATSCSLKSHEHLQVQLTGFLGATWDPALDAAVLALSAWNWGWDNWRGGGRWDNDVVTTGCHRGRWSWSAAAVAAGWRRDTTAGCTRVELWTWNWVLIGGRELLVDVEEDTRVALLVQLSTSDTSWVGGTAASDLEVDALWVWLGTTITVTLVESDGLVAQDIIAWGNVGWDLDSPGVVVGDHVIVGELWWGGADICHADTVDLEELESGLVDARAVAIAVCEVVEDWAVVGLWPLSPLQRDRFTGGDWGTDGARSSTTSADDVRVAVGCTRNWTAVLRFRRAPADDLWGRRLVLLNMLVL